ncbi:MAG: glycosyltransferase [Desulfovibrio sp.]|jgi:glycosyltransferase involved in cell wall biosynthesis|nr:glycosyltransferase [Desulfovibrio sp.]
MEHETFINFTMPVFNRLKTTQRALLALRKTTTAIPFKITVVDNGSDEGLVRALKELHKGRIIDKLFLLPKNMGIACACNIGWEMTKAQVYCKIDNDTAPLRPDWTKRLFALWSHGRPVSNLGFAQNEDVLLANPGALHTEDGVLGICVTNLIGNGIFIPEGVSDILGMWSEEYGEYGAEDGDYGLRMQFADFPQYYYLRDGYLDSELDGTGEAEYEGHGLHKTFQHKRLFVELDGKPGYFVINHYLFSSGIRSPHVRRRYEIRDIDGEGRVDLAERGDYRETRKALRECRRLILKHLESAPDAVGGKSYVLPHDAEDVLYGTLRNVMRDCGQDIDAFEYERSDDV